MNSFAFYNLKGGVGKTTSTINLAYLAAKDGLKTLVWDLDPQGAASFYLGVKSVVKNESKKILKDTIELQSAIQLSPFENLSIIPADLSARQADLLLSEQKQSKKRIATLIASLRGKYDVVIIDSPPGISLLHDNIFNAVKWILIPNIPTTLSIRSYDTLVQYFKEEELDKQKLRCFFSMVDSRKNLHSDTIHFFFSNNQFFKSYIPYLSEIEKMGINEAPLETFAKNSYAAQCYRDLWEEIKKCCF